ncbi:MAG: hypothetical protein WA957_17210, partial [Alteraurantiacibacter sp.]
MKTTLPAIRALLAALAIMLTPLCAVAQNDPYQADVDFVIDVLRNDYAGWDTKTADGQAAE